MRPIAIALLCGSLLACAATPEMPGRKAGYMAAATATDALTSANESWQGARVPTPGARAGALAAGRAW